ncbi:MAG: tRNA pseudouridine(38-40) synthase TruA [Desulfobacteraceae bacterium]|nr:tRNA pseudouridine(38-40) synthase TruA [Desulfobacteraceae bacterium]MDD3993287.1 tRNA pseudouridine(38-40) synthase TruA [Desulfobacteraceae bacterium]
MPSFKLTIEYDGTAYCGWQRQAGDPTVQETIERALASMVNHPVSLAGAGRTDAGVHALGQVAHFRADTRLTAEVFLKGLNSLLPEDIVIRACHCVPDAFHARYDARGKHYRYRILNRPRPMAIGRNYAWHVRHPLDIAVMRQAAAVLCGTHDFKSFEGAGSPRSSTVRTIFRCELTPCEEDLLHLDIAGDGFLRHMVRNIAGTLVEVGSGRRPPDDVPAILAARDRHRAGITAPARGLFLVGVDYGQE